MGKYRPLIGDVVYNNNIPHVIMGMENYENMGSMSYDRKYLLIPQNILEQIINNKQNNIINWEKIIEKGHWIKVVGNTFPNIEKVDTTPYKIQKIIGVTVEKMIPRTITIYE